MLAQRLDAEARLEKLKVEEMKTKAKMKMTQVLDQATQKEAQEKKADDDVDAMRD